MPSAIAVLAEDPGVKKAQQDTPTLFVPALYLASAESRLPPVQAFFLGISCNMFFVPCCTLLVGSIYRLIFQRDQGTAAPKQIA